MKYQSELINEILEQRGHKKSSLHLLDMSVPIESTSQNLMSFAFIVEEE